MWSGNLIWVWSESDPSPFDLSLIVWWCDPCLTLVWSVWVRNPKLHSFFPHWTEASLIHFKNQRQCKFCICRNPESLSLLQYFFELSPRVDAICLHRCLQRCYLQPSISRYQCLSYTTVRFQLFPHLLFSSIVKTDVHVSVFEGTKQQNQRKIRPQFAASPHYLSTACHGNYCKPITPTKLKLKLPELIPADWIWQWSTSNLDSLNIIGMLQQIE